MGVVVQGQRLLNAFRGKLELLIQKAPSTVDQDTAQ
jgi:hypothetical protein